MAHIINLIACILLFIGSLALNAWLLDATIPYKKYLIIRILSVLSAFLSGWMLMVFIKG